MIRTFVMAGVAAVCLTGFAQAEAPAGEAPAGKHERMKQKMQEHWNQTDTDANGAISKAEFLAEAEQKFTKMDTNADGQITQDEREAMHQKMKDMWKKGGEAHHPKPEAAPAKP